ncbi:MAG: cell division protein FtsL [Anaerovoracaceae bacterium]|jgi:cell division protein FtsL
MNTAEKIYEGQEAYRARQRGIDLDVHPSRGRQHKKTGITATDKKHVLVMMLVVGLIFIGVIIAGAYAATINYQNNQIEKTNSELQGEVESLHIEIKSANNIANIEQKATKKLGMVYPEGKQLVVVSGNQKPDKNFAGDLKENALN